MPIAPAVQTRLVLFCGGRGSSTIIRELVRWPHVKLSLLVNAYDDGLSTGELRRFVPAMLGPSDFRKNLSTLLNPHSAEQYALQQVLEHRVPKDFSPEDVAALETFAHAGRGAEQRGAFGKLFDGLSPRLCHALQSYLSRFFDYYRASSETLDFADCSLGNLIFAGAFLESNYDFNASIRNLASLCNAEADLINVSSGEPRTLVALKANGEVLSREVEIVSPQSPSPIVDLFFLPGPVTPAQMSVMDGMAVEQKRQALKTWEVKVTISEEAAGAIREADLIVYGPGTQFSSLFPSYRVGGLVDCIRDSRAKAKILVCNLETDHDIQSLSLTDLVSKALEMMSDPENQSGSITHVLYNGPSLDRSSGVKLDEISSVRGEYKGALIVRDNFQNPVKPSVHSGYSIVKRVLALHEAQAAPENADSLDVYVDLLDRSQATETIFQEFLDLPWQDKLGRVRLRVNGRALPEMTLPPHMSAESTRNVDAFSEIDSLLDWIENSDSGYLLTLAGDGEYRLRDVFLALEVCHSGVFGAVYGSRTQSRRQFRTSLRSAYGESSVLYGTSWLAGFLFSALLGLRLGVVLSDPLTGFRIYRRSWLNENFRKALARRRPRSAAEVTKLLVQSGVEIAEIPVSYRTFAGFTKPSWRILRAIKNLKGLL